MAGNNLSQIPNIQSLVNMRWLNLSFNEIEVIPEGIFRGMTSFYHPTSAARSIRLCYNRLHQFPRDLLEMKALQELHLAGNNIDGS